MSIEPVNHENFTHVWVIGIRFDPEEKTHQNVSFPFNISEITNKTFDATYENMKSLKIADIQELIKLRLPKLLSSHTEKTFNACYDNIINKKTAIAPEQQGYVLDAVRVAAEIHLKMLAGQKILKELS